MLCAPQNVSPISIFPTYMLMAVAATPCVWRRYARRASWHQLGVREQVILSPTALKLANWAPDGLCQSNKFGMIAAYFGNENCCGCCIRRFDCICSTTPKSELHGSSILLQLFRFREYYQLRESRNCCMQSIVNSTTRAHTEVHQLGAARTAGVHQDCSKRRLCSMNGLGKGYGN